MQQITGINAVFFYAPTIFEQSGVGTNAAFAQATWVGLTNVIFTVVAMLLIDRLGRKPLLIAGLTGIIVSMSLVSYGFGQATYTLTNDSIASIELDAKPKRRWARLWVHALKATSPSRPPSAMHSASK